jgi:multidrug efflux pump subunit AcrA (membrane-fusion protein)
MIARIGSLVLPLLAVGSLAYAGWHVYRANQPLPQVAPPMPPVVAPYRHALAASGVVEPTTEDVAIGTHVSGVIERVYVAAGDRVAVGDPLFRIDTRQADAELAVREAGLADAEAQLNRLRSLPRPEALPASAARVHEAQAEVVAADDAHRRTARLAEARTVPDAELISRRQELERARQRLAAAIADHELLEAGAWKEDIAVAESAVRRARAHVEQARTEIARLTVASPIDGHVLKVDVRAGEQVGTASDRRLMVLGSVQPLCVRTDIDESEIPRFDKNAVARAHLRGDPERSYRLRFVRVEPYVIPKQSLTGDNRERVDTRVLQVVYAVEGDATDLFVGQQVDVFIDVGDHAGTGAAPRLWPGALGVAARHGRS